MGASDISWWNLGFAYLLVAIPLAVIRYYRMGIVRDTFVSVARMTIQLFLVGVYLEFIFQLNHPLVNLAWLVVMLLVTALTVIQRTRLPWRIYFSPVFFSVLCSVLLIDFYLLVVVLRLDNWVDAAYLIPISGMLIGNSLSDLVVSLNLFYTSLGKQQNTYRFALANGATQGEALAPFMRDAIKISLNRGLANTAVMGLVSLPDMMTGQILGGSSPQVAIKYQILIMLTIFVSSTVSIFLALYFSRKRAFDAYQNVKKLF